MPKIPDNISTETHHYFGKNNPALDVKTTAKIFGYLETSTLVNKASLVSKQWKKVIEDEFADPIYLSKLYQTILKNIVPFKNESGTMLSTKKLAGGLTNTTLFFKIPKGKFVVRRPGKKSEYFIDRSSESYNAKIASDIGINAKIILSASDGTQVSEYLITPHPMNIELFRNSTIIDKAAAILKTIHRCGKLFANDVDIFARNKKMLEILQKNRQTLSIDYINTAKKMNEIESIFKTLNIQKVPCHNDTTTSNFIITQDQMKLIDWEYSGNNDPIWDLACLSMEGEFTAEQDLHMLKAYFGTYEHSEYLRFILFKPVVEYWVALWSLVQISNKNYEKNPITLQQMEQQRFNHCLQILDSNEFKNAFASLNKMQFNYAGSTSSAARFS